MGKKYEFAMEQEQELLVNIANIISTIYNMESCILRTDKANKSSASVNQKKAYTEIYCQEAFQEVRDAAMESLAYMYDGEQDQLQLSLAILRKYTTFVPKSLIHIKREAGKNIIHEGGYIL